METLCHLPFMGQLSSYYKRYPPPSHVLGRMDIDLSPFRYVGFPAGLERKKRGWGAIWVVRQTPVICVYLRLSYIIAYYVMVRLRHDPSSLTSFLLGCGAVRRIKARHGVRLELAGRFLPLFPFRLLKSACSWL